MESPTKYGNPEAGLPPLVSGEGVAALLLEGHSVRVRVQGRSMTPSINDGALLTLIPTVQAPLLLGDVGFFRSKSGQLICHRVLATRRFNGTRHLGFRGDAFTSALVWANSTDIIGKVIDQDGHRIAGSRERWSGLLRAWGRWFLAQAGILLGALRRQITSSPDRG